VGVSHAKREQERRSLDHEILTPDVPLATLDKDGVLEMEVCVERGRGYVPAEKHALGVGRVLDELELLKKVAMPA